MNEAQELTPQEAIIVRQTQDGRIHCPYCAHDRRKSHLKTCSITIEHDRVLYDCHHCGEGGMVPLEQMVRSPSRRVAPIPTNLKRKTSAVVEFFASRGVGIEDMSTLPPMVTGSKYFHELGEEVPAIGFVYGSREAPEAIKWRALHRKAFTQDGRAASFYGIERLQEGDDDLYIVEGEADVVALATLGIRAISVPNGAPMKLSNRRVRPQDDKKFSYLWDAKDLLESYKRIVLAVDQDEPGDALVEEIGRRIGRARCWRPVYPDGCKDVTDVLHDYGADEVRRVFKDAQPLPLQGIFAAKDYMDRLQEVYRDGLAKGVSTGFKSVDNLFTINPGRLTIVTGYPGCLHGDTKVCLSSGRWVPMREVAAGMEVLSYDRGHCVTDRVKDVWRSGRKECFKLRTRRGREIIATGDHRFMTFEGWKRLSEIDADNDFIAIPEALIPATGADGSLHRAEAVLLAVWLAEGVKERGAYRFSCGNEEVIDGVRRAGMDMGYSLTKYSDSLSYGLRASLPFKDAEGRRTYRAKMRYHFKNAHGMEGGDVEAAVESAVTRRDSAVAVETPRKMLSRLGVPDDCTTYTAGIPDSVFGASDEVIADFVGFLFACDGSAYGGTIEYATSSKRLAQDLQLLLLRFGIQSIVREKSTPCRPAYPLTISDSVNRKRFVEAFHVPGKMAAFKAASERPSTSGHVNDSVPAAVVMPRLRHGTKYYKKHCGHGINPRRTGGKDRGLVGRLAQHDADEWLMERCSRGLRWDSIRSIEPWGEAETYDLETERFHNFVAEGVVTHNSGKSEFVDQITVNLARNEDWKFAVASFENPPHIHIAKLAEKIIGKPFHDGPTPRMTQADLDSAMEFIDERFTFLESKDGALPTIDSIMDRTKQAVLRLGVRGLIVDPYNYIHRDHNVAEYEWISQILTQMSHFAKAHDLHIWFIAHPQKVQPNESGEYPVPKGQQISGSAAWFAKADIGITVHRGYTTEIHCWKVRFKWEGSLGMTNLDYDIVTGRYREVTLQRAPEGKPNAADWTPPHWQDTSDRQQLGF